jgi:hypothetical protein
MAFPTDRLARHRFLVEVRNELKGIGPTVSIGKARAKLGRIGHQARQGLRVGQFVLSLLQMHAHHRPATIDRALRLIRAALLHNGDLPLHKLERANRLTGADWHRARRALAGNNIWPTTLLQEFHKFRPVAHLWAAYVLEVLLMRRDRSHVESSDGVPDFCSIASEIARLAGRVRLKTRPASALLPANLVLQMRLPGGLGKSVSLKIPHLRPFELALATPCAI